MKFLMAGLVGFILDFRYSVNKDKNEINFFFTLLLKNKIRSFSIYTDFRDSHFLIYYFLILGKFSKKI